MGLIIKDKKRLANSEDIERNELSKNAMGGTELMASKLMSLLPTEYKEKFQFICSRVRELEADKKKILWLHDLPMDPESQHLKDAESRKRFDKLVFVSNYQFMLYNMMLSVPYSESIVLRNAIEPIPVHTKPDTKDNVRLIYHTTPHRGLNILVPVFYEIAKEDPNVILDVYSSFKIYGWEERDKEFEHLFQMCRDHPQINYHGVVSNDELKTALTQAHIFAYPSIWVETSCIAAIEAMSAGCLVLCPNYGALPETTANLSIMYQWHEDMNTHATIFYHNLKHLIERYRMDLDGIQNHMIFSKNYADAMYSWDVRISEWVEVLKSIDNRE